MQVSVFPQTANNKIDRKALRDPLDSEVTDDLHGGQEDNNNEEEESELDRGEEESKKEVTIGKGVKRLKCDMQGIVFDEQKAAKMAMAKHILDMVEKVCQY